MMKTGDNSMRKELTLEDLAVMAESFDLECKAAQGWDGQGELPQDVWKSKIFQRVITVSLETMKLVRSLRGWRFEVNIRGTATRNLSVAISK
jgi:hypothetical protein